MENSQNVILALLKEATGKSDVSSMEFRNIDFITKDRVDFKKVRGSVRLMSERIKTMADVERMRKAFLSLQLP